MLSIVRSGDAARRGHPSHGTPPALNEVDPCTNQGFAARLEAAVSGTLVLLCLMGGRRALWSQIRQEIAGFRSHCRGRTRAGWHCEGF